MLVVNQLIGFGVKRRSSAAAYPTILGVSNGNRGTSRSTSSSVNLPSGSVSGDRTIVAIATENSASITVPGSWSAIGTLGSFGGYRYQAFYADSIGAGPVSVSHSNARTSWVCIRLGNVHASAPESATLATGSSTAPDAGTLTASWGAAANLFLVIGAAGYGTISGQSFTAAPSGYTPEVSEPGPSGQSGTILQIASLQTLLATEDPGAATISSSTNWIAQTIIIRPA